MKTYVFLALTFLSSTARALDPQPWDPRLAALRPKAVLVAQADAPNVAPMPVAAPTPTATRPLAQWQMGKGWALQLPSVVQLESVNGLALRDYYNGQWLMGYGHEVAYLTRHGDEILYTDIWNVFNTDDGRGAFGGSLGVHPAAAFYDTFGAIFGAEKSFGQALPPWAQKLNNFISVEVGEGYRLFGGGGPAKRRVDVIGGEINVPFGSWFNHTGSL